jgi:hypothetical protein
MKFYETFWEVIKNDLMVMFRQLQGGELPPYKVNFGVITLLLKKVNAVEIQQCRPICNSNVSFNFFYKGEYKSQYLDIDARLHYPTILAP